MIRPSSCNRIVVSTSRCGRDNPGSNPGYSILFSNFAIVAYKKDHLKRPQRWIFKHRNVRFEYKFVLNQ